MNFEYRRLDGEPVYNFIKFRKKSVQIHSLNIVSSDSWVIILTETTEGDERYVSSERNIAKQT
jgi:hypothetical protein